MKTAKKLNLTVVIPCASDTKIKSCIQSIDADVEIIVVLNGPTKDVIKIVDSFKIKKISVPQRNLAKALNIGVNRAKHDKVVLIDSDCIFQKRAIEKACIALEYYPVVKGKVIFESNSLSSKIVAETREYVYNNPPKIYNPFLCIDKKIKNKVGGYYFDEDIFWTEDADLSSRIIKAKIPVKFLTTAKANHASVSILYDLKSAFRYGIGRYLRVYKKKTVGINAHWNNIPDIAIKKGISKALYYLVWNVVYSIGFLYQSILSNKNKYMFNYG